MSFEINCSVSNLLPCSTLVQSPHSQHVCIAILGAGRDTTAALLSWLFVELAKNTRVFSRLRETILVDFGESEASVSNITFSKLKSCRYLQYAIQETLRLHPPIPTNGRQAIRSTTLPVGGGEDGTKPVAVRKGQVVVFCVYGMHRRKDIWGEDADEFRPERWEGLKMDWSYLPFSGGPRICLGRKYLSLLSSSVPSPVLDR